MTKKEIKDLIKSEINWCENNPQTMPEGYCKGFIQGLKQAIILVTKYSDKM